MRSKQKSPTRAAALGVAAALALALAGLAAEPPAKESLLTLPDLAVEKIDFELVKRQTRADGVTPCQVFNLRATLVNRGARASQPFRVRVDRKKPNWELACLECSSNEPGLVPKESRVFGPRQFNNCSSGDLNEFRVALDPLGRPDLQTGNNSMEKTFVPPPLITRPPRVLKEKPQG